MNNLCKHCSQPIDIRHVKNGQRFSCPRCRSILVMSATGVELEQVGGPQPSNINPPQSMQTAKSKSPFSDLDSSDDDDRPIRSRSQREGTGIVDFLMFRMMLTPWLIRLTFWFGTIFCIGYGGFQIISAIGQSQSKSVEGDRFETGQGTGRNHDRIGAKSGVSIVMVFSGVFTMIFGPFILRLLCEEMIIFFQMNDELRELNRTMVRLLNKQRR